MNSLSRLFFGILFGCVAISGCGGGEAPTNGKSSNGSTVTRNYEIAVIPKGTTHEFWKSVHAGAEQAARELGNVVIIWKGPQLENDRAGQIDVVQGFITREVDGICLAPLDSQALVEYVAQAVEEDIPVLIFDSGLNDESQIVSYVATDNFQGGALAAERLAESLGGRGNVILLRYTTGSESTTQREEGFLKTLADKYPEIKVISSNEYAGTTPEESLSKATQVLSRHRDEVQGIFAVCEPNATGTLKALEELELAGKVKFVAFDPNADLIRGMEQGKVDGIVLQDPVKMGYQAVKTIMQRILDKEAKIDSRISTGEHVATPENMNTPEMQKLLKPVQFERGK